jgi:hypothetical protein
MGSYYIIKNGYYIPLIFPLVYYITNDAFLATIIMLKTFSSNYYYWFENQYHYLPRGYNWVKQFIRFTDTGHLISFMTWLNPHYLPLAFTIHFVITTGFWSGKIWFSMKDGDKLYIPDIEPVFESIWSAANHGLALVFLTQKIRSFDECIPFTIINLQHAYIWSYGWFVCIYIPWRLYTGDIVYSMLDYKHNKKITIIFFALMHILIFMGHIIGVMLSVC